MRNVYWSDTSVSCTLNTGRKCRAGLGRFDINFLENWQHYCFDRYFVLGYCLSECRLLFHRGGIIVP